jgi:ATP-dependent helicase HrpB
MADLPLHPRLAHMVLQGIKKQLGTLACDLAAVLSERDLLKGSVGQDQADLRSKMEEYYRQSHGGTGSGVIQRICQNSQSWQKMLGITAHTGNQRHKIDYIGILLAQAYPDRIAQRQANESRRYKLANGRLARFRHPDPLEHQEYLVVADLDGTQPLSHIYVAAPIHREKLFKDFVDLLETKECVEWNEATQSVGSNREQRLGQLILEKSRLPKPNSELVVAALLKGIRINGLSCLPWTKTQHNWQARVQFLRQVMGPETDWPDVSNNTLLKILEWT